MRFTAYSLWFSALAFASGIGSSAAKSEIVFRSGPREVPLIELYTSEGCSSCPPAEDWLSGLREQAGLWREYVPVAFHVTYWDKLGWRDAFAATEFTRRQYDYADLWRSGSVYTPCFVRGGREWHPTAPVPLEGEVRGSEVGQLVVRYDGKGKCEVRFSPRASAGAEWEAHVVALAGHIASKVKAGENAGRTLYHDFVAKEWIHTRLSDAGEGVWAGTLTLQNPSSSDGAALAVWITRAGELAPVQATGGWVDDR
jgi:hypothetical protein